MNNPMNYFRLGALALLWGSSFLLIKLALTALAPTQIALVRIVLGALVLLALCAVRGLQVSRDRALWRHVAVAALFASALPWVLFGIGEQTVDSGLTGVLNATTPLWTVLFGLLVGREALPPARIGGLLLGFLGVLLIFAPWQGTSLLSWGVLACLGAAVSYGIGYVYIGRNLTGGHGLPPLVLATMQMIAATGYAVVALPLDGLRPVHWDLLALVSAAVLGVFGTGIAFALNYRIISEEGATTASTVAYLMPIVSVLLGWLLLGEELGLRILLGMAVVLVGVLLTRRSPSPGTTTAEEEKMPEDDRTEVRTSTEELPPIEPPKGWARFHLALMRGSQIYAELATNHPMK
ncbi:Permease of the drug/metabolite transporter (DMT) superfamily [Saccharopolyspora kobensis]|uniref:Permease of the drug/metabolite transporter (DMT) superfamily n=1 Tax=Saccharopolyspora kobensis TaxID=146035 RepID=A0A1H6ED50_9PSEU|nr:DMT family transporter [Saccharopolyspora kobensis]SEG95191.1 Permease of the drug/metabolite transporter (DMT) superfamily [Saccharopolyspora kobensis]SFD59271.1 Permease of the drug/metabolite transporter (DMT) superfamily [Saccharopolyspora kobensis]